MGFMVGYKVMKHYNAKTSTSFANSIESPGRKKYNAASKNTKELVDKYAQHMIKDFEDKKKSAKKKSYSKE